MMRRRWPLIVSLMVSVALAAPPRASGQPSRGDTAQAQALFDEGLGLMRAGRYGDACPKLARSQELDPGMGTKYRLAECYAGLGRLASAWALFMEVAEEARKTKRADREEQARELADALRPRLPMITIAIPPAIAGAPGLEVKRDGARVERLDWNQKVPVDPGEHEIVVTATGKRPWQTRVMAQERAEFSVTVPALDDLPAPAAAAATNEPAPAPEKLREAPAEPEARSGSGQRVAAVVTGVVGLAGIGVGSTLGFMAKSTWEEALSHCPGGDRTRCSETGISLGNEASTSATISTIGFVVGGAAVAAGIILWATAPAGKPSKAGFRVVPAVGADGVCGMVQGAF
jgi:hypothetical protein